LFTEVRAYFLFQNAFRYEISNFSYGYDKGYESVHNLKYWNLDNYLGIGPSAHSLINNKRFYSENSIQNFIKEEIILKDSVGGTVEEYLMLTLRLSVGCRNDSFKKKFGICIPDEYYKKAQKLPSMAICDEVGIRLTKKGLLVSNSVITNILF